MLIFKQVLGAALMLCGITLVSHAQAITSAPIDTRPQRPGAPRDINAPEREMLTRAAIRHEEANHRESVARAKESSDLGAQLFDTFSRYQALSREDIKKLERMEKLARKIRGGVGGSDDDTELKDPPRDLAIALKRLVELSEDLHKTVEKTTRHVISAAVIERSNEVIELIRHIRTITHP